MTIFYSHWVSKLRWAKSQSFLCHYGNLPNHHGNLRLPYEYLWLGAGYVQIFCLKSAGSAMFSLILLFKVYF